jgi:RNA polymerase sigma-70 factor (ECF subfamily)
MERAPEETSLESLSARAAQGDRGAFTDLVLRTHRVVYRVALRIVGIEADAEEVAQETYIRAWQGLATVRSHAATQGWICQIARHVAHDRVRARGRRRAEPIEPLLPEIRADDPSADEQLGSARLSARVQTALSGLKEKHRLVLSLREMDGMSYEEIADALGCAVGTVESRLHRARKALAKKVKAMEKEMSS